MALNRVLEGVIAVGGFMLAASGGADGGLYDALKTFGVSAGLVAFFVWRDWKREEAQSTEINSTNKWIREELFRVLEKNNQLIDRFNELQERDDSRRCHH